MITLCISTCGSFVVLWHGVVWARVGDREGRERVCWLHVVCMFVGVDVGVGGSGGVEIGG